MNKTKDKKQSTTTTTTQNIKIRDKNEWIDHTLKLLEIEKESEIEESVSLQSTLSNRQLELKGICIRKLVIESFSTGLGGRCLVRLVPVNAAPNQDLPPHKFTPGDVVGLRALKTQPGQSLVTGIVYRVDRSRITVAYDDLAESTIEQLQGVFAIDKLANDITYRKMRDAIERLKTTNSPITDILFSNQEPTHTIKKVKISAVSKKLNQPQIEAIEFALSSNEIALIHGPPGTGKTTTVVEFIVQVCKGGGRVLACGPSNLSVDNILERLLEFKDIVNPTRIGHPARILSGLTKHTLDHKTKNGQDAQILKEIKIEIATLMKQLKDGQVEKGARRSVYNTIRDLRKDLKNREFSLVDQVIRNSNVILSTNTGAADYVLSRCEPFDWVIIDEAAQALEASCWIPISRGKKLLLAGDHQQLPPTIHSEQAKSDGLETTMFERLIQLYQENISRLLSVQYRMNQEIMRWSSDEFYHGRMLADNSVANHLLLERSTKNRVATTTTCPLMLIDTSGLDMEESADDESQSKFNVGEADIVVKYIEKLLRYGVEQSSIGVITPYNGQVKQLKMVLSNRFSDIEIGTVDGFQGREKEVVIISTVRSNAAPHNVGFLAEERRMNVAITRAKRQVTLVSDTDTLSSNPFLARMVEYFKLNGELRSALEYLEEQQVSSDEESWSKSKDDDDDKVNNDESNNNVGYQSKARQSQAELKKEKRAKKKEKEHAKTKVDHVNRSEQERQQDLQQIQSVIDSFLKSSNSVYTFPSTTTNFQRLLIHELAEKLDLQHESTGEANQRVITITKKIKVDHKVNKEQEDVDDEEDVEDNNDDEEEDDEDTTSTTTTTSSSSTTSKSKKKKKKNNKSKPVESKKPAAPKKKQPTVPKKDLGEELLESFNNIQIEPIDITKCGIKNCKNNVQLLGRVCEFCSRKFCNHHFLYEIHGCGDRAKAKARSDWFDAYAKQNKDSKSQSHSKVKDSIKEAEAARKKKTDDNKSKKK
ncbi:AN1-type zinc finger-containing protein [Heterostelium album PN500]|uniref:AN1-type zinc finger-containing protein n=1 Tax=Heterostelium pallidum (strain ATCC 26659 / Pp 5 / PN500) TaxID=670386 RepID=D3BJ28_HETP5|nr:AN1-type zinc finger-containing protein [Heterostelium album PN500]EFA77908.1 AN1-type zinc finger-containing protein [Heterostelium album PN500]|eukprot:XP_020430036.1 AN1-type zinc finger-containing protein [Heterostelium album PN500]